MAEAPRLVLPLGVWLAVQLLALAIGAGGVPVSAAVQRPVETLSFSLIVFAQLAMASLIWPMLFGDARRSTVVIATALPFLQAGAFLSATPSGLAFPVAVAVVLWLVALALLPATPRWRVVLWLIVVQLSIGGAAIAFFRGDYTPDAKPLPLGPMSIAYQLLDNRPPDAALWAAILLPAAVAATMRILTRSGHSR